PETRTAGGRVPPEIPSRTRAPGEPRAIHGRRMPARKVLLRLRAAPGRVRGSAGNNLLAPDPPAATSQPTRRKRAGARGPATPSPPRTGPADLSAPDNAPGRNPGALGPAGRMSKP